MANIIDYLAWRGDLSLDRSPFNAVDALILSTLAYLPLDGIAQAELDENSPTLGDIAAAFAGADGAGPRARSDDDAELLAKAAATARFGSVRAGSYVNRTDERAEKQFSAVSFSTGDGSVFVAYRGTDKSLVGWKEDLNMSFMAAVPAQKDAVRYLNRAASSDETRLRVGGHSKGGNLAAYAAAFCEPEAQARVEAVYKNDGPGFSAAALRKPGYRAVRSRIRAYVPQSSIVGMLLENDEDRVVVRSRKSGIMQHDPYSWEVLGADFVRMEGLSSESRYVDQTLKEWIGAMSPEQRERFIEALYDVLTATGAKDLTELSRDWLKHALAINRTLKAMDAPTRKVLDDTLALLWKSAAGNLSAMVPLEELRGRITR